jgi:dipeptidyl aminopeptidase/acylaminoacyl peptidase
MPALAIAGTLFLSLHLSPTVAAESPDDELFRPLDVFRLEHASDPRISPDGKHIVYVRNFMDIIKDRRRSNLWIINKDGTEHRPLTSAKQNDVAPRWSRDGKRLLYVSSSGGAPQIYCRWMDSGQTAKLTDVTSTPMNAAWSPDGMRIAFAMAVPEPAKPFVDPPKKPEGAEWSRSAQSDPEAPLPRGRRRVSERRTHAIVPVVR